MRKLAVAHADHLTAAFPSLRGGKPSSHLVAPCAVAEPTEAHPIWQMLPPLEPRAETGQRDPSTSDKSEQASSQLIEQARLEAAGIVSAAQARAAQALDAAEAEASAVRTDAAASGYSSGFEQATREVTEQLTRQFEARACQLRAEVDGIVRSIIEAREAMWQAAEGELTTLALEIARKVIKTEVSQNPDLVGAVVKDALRRVSNRDSVRILVHPGVLDRVRENRADILLALDNVQNLAIDGDQRVGMGGCVIETNAGSIDAKVDTQLELVGQALRG